jgi:hypothetical protein
VISTATLRLEEAVEQEERRKREDAVDIVLVCYYNINNRLISKRKHDYLNNSFVITYLNKHFLLQESLFRISLNK